jgi:cytochrome c556
MNKANVAILALSLLVSVSFAKDKTEIQKDMAAQEGAMSTIQKGLLYSSKDIVNEGVKALKEANKAASLKDHLAAYLPEGKKALYKNAMQQGENVNKHADAMLKALNENRFKDAFESYGKTLNACNTCHIVIRSWK